jgi:uncharacterized membrane protein
MSDTGEEEIPDPVPLRRRSRAMVRLRAYFLTGLVIAAPLFLTIAITWWFVQWIDSLVTPFIPWQYRPDRFLPYYVPGFGLVVALIFITLLGFLTRNYVGGRLVALSESLVGRMPIVRSLYRGIKQIFETVVSSQAKAFQTVGLIEYPRKGLWSIVFIAADSRGEIEHHLNETVAVFLPTTPNPTSGFLLFIKRSDIVLLDMTLEDAAKLVISGGLVTPAYAGPKKRPAKIETLNPPSAA